MSTQADKVRAAADYIERIGLYKGNLYDHAALAGILGEAYGEVTDALQEGYVTRYEIPCCTYGALVAFSKGDDGDLLNGFMEHIGEPGAAVGPWNDAPERTKEEVVDALRRFADTLDAQP